MTFDLFLPYMQGASIDIKDNMNGYYKTEQDYADALLNEDRTNGSLVYDAWVNGGVDSSVYYGDFENSVGYKAQVNNKVLFAKAECILLSPDGKSQETVDSVIDLFASQREFLIAAHFDMEKMDSEFEEEIRGWANETLNILKLGNEIKKKEGPQAGDMWVEQNIPKRSMRLSFINKSGKRVNFALRHCEVERKIARNRYLFYVNKMEIIK